MKYALVYINPETKKAHQVYLNEEYQTYLETLVDSGMFGGRLTVNEEPLGELKKEE